MNPVPRSVLFIPAVRGDLVDKAPGVGADVVVLDLEDGVAPPRKAEARAQVAAHLRALQQAGQQTWVRVNAWPVGVPDDIAALAGARPDAIAIPKARSRADVAAVGDALATAGLGAVPLVAAIEDAIGVLDAAAIAGSPRVVALGMGAEDLSASLGVTPSVESLSVPAQLIAVAAASAGLPAFGVPGSLADYTNLPAFELAARKARAIGFAGALCVHPGQVPIANAVFQPTAEELSWARRVLERAGATVAVGSEVGMIDAPVLKRAERIVSRASGTGGNVRDGRVTPRPYI